MNRRHWLAVGAIALGFGGFGAWVGSRRYTVDSAEAAAVDLLFGLTLPDVEAAPVALNQWRGQPLLVNFWATWCPPCVEEMPELSEFDVEFRPRGLRTVGIGIDSADNVRQFSEKMPMSYPLLVAGTSGVELVRRFGNTAGALPYSVLIDRDGRITWRMLGRFKTAALREAILAVV